MCGPEVFIEAVSGFESIDMYTERGRERVNEIRAARQERHGINMMPSVASKKRGAGLTMFEHAS